MFEAQLLTASSSVEVYSPWFPRGGDSARFTLDVIKSHATSGATITFEVEAWTKNREETGDGADADTSVSISSVSGRTTTEWLSTSSVGFKELVRYRFILGNSGKSGTVWILFRMLPPVWFDAVNA